MNFKLYQNGNIVNTIEATPDFVQKYASQMGYIFEEMPTDETPEAVLKSDSERIASLEAENKLLKAQLRVQSESHDFLEDCITEMAQVVYA